MKCHQDFVSLSHKTDHKHSRRHTELQPKHKSNMFGFTPPKKEVKQSRGIILLFHVTFKWSFGWRLAEPLKPGIWAEQLRKHQNAVSINTRMAAERSTSIILI